jgi:hypothetical protein
MVLTTKAITSGTIHETQYSLHSHSLCLQYVSITLFLRINASVRGPPGAAGYPYARTIITMDLLVVPHRKSEQTPPEQQCSGKELQHPLGGRATEAQVQVFFSALAALTGVLGLGRGYSSSFQKERKGGVGRRVYGLLRTRNRQSPLTPPPPFPSSPVQETQKEKGTLVVPQLRTTLSFTKSKVL